jgi:outer membrane protein assembly factor BamA
MLAMRSRIFAIFFFMLASIPHLLFAGSTFRLQTVRVVGSHRFREEDLIASLNLKLGSDVDVGALQQAADRLMQTGVLASLEYKYTPLSAGIAVEYDVTDATGFLPCRYDNIVWISDADLTKAVHEKVPLFSGEAPTSGELLDQVSLAVSEVLAKSGVVTKVRYELHTRGINGPVDAILFVSETFKPKVQGITLTGATLMTPEEKIENTKRLIGDDYSAARMHDSLASGLSFLYGSKGYLRVQVGEPEAKIVGAPLPALVAVTVPVTEGAQYRLKSVGWSGNSVIPTAELETPVLLRAGDVADHGKLEMELQDAQKDYRSKGYLVAKVEPVPTFSDEDHTVSYQMKVSEGDQFHMGDLHMTGLDQGALDKLKKNWKLNRGDVYDGEYLKTFLRDNASLINGNGHAKSIKVLQNPTADKTVDVTLQF